MKIATSQLLLFALVANLMLTTGTAKAYEMNVSQVQMANTNNYLRGDVNMDNSVDINDVTDLIDYLLTNDASNISLSNADANKDGEVDISDVTDLIDCLLLDGWPDDDDDETFTVDGVTFKMVAVEGGTFLMGATSEQSEYAQSHEYPVHQVTLSDFSIGETEVTQALWVAVMGSNPSYDQSDLNKPVERVSYDDCCQFIVKLNQLTGRNFVLPTEAQWEFAARGGNMSNSYIYAGSNNINDVCWYDQNTIYVGQGTQPVGSLDPNELGLYDMSGNVHEWCYDFYGSYPSESQTNPTGPTSATDYNQFRVARGGSIGWPGNCCRVSSRERMGQAQRKDSFGLRLAL